MGGDGGGAGGVSDSSSTMMTEDPVVSLAREVSLMSQVHHPNVVNILGAGLDRKQQVGGRDKTR